MIEAIIFDLDSCISAANEPGELLYEPVFEAIKASESGSHSDPDLQRAFHEMWRLPFDFVAERYSFTNEMKDAGWNAFLKIEVMEAMQGYGDLPVLNKIPQKKFLVTSGFRRLQESKIRALNITSIFSEIVVDAIDEPGVRGKLEIIRGLMNKHRLEPGRMLIVGDNADSELAAGRTLGIRTAQTLRPGVPIDPGATFHIAGFTELAALLESL